MTVDYRRKFERQALELADTRRRLADIASAPQLAFSSFTAGIGRGIDEKNPMTLETVASFGGHFDGTHGAIAYTSPTPPTPTAPTAEGGPGLLTAGWDGHYVDADGQPDLMIVSPLGFAYVELHAAQATAGPDFDAQSTSTLLATINTARGGLVTTGLPAGDYWVRLVARTIAGKPSGAGPATQVTVAPLVDTAQLEADLSTAQGTLAAAQGRLDAAEEDLDLAFSVLDQVPAQISTAQQAAITAAAADATTKADTAKQAALDAVGLKGEIITQVSAPTGARAAPQNLWIRLPDNRPHRWNPDSALVNKWEAVTDQVAIDAAAAAATAQTKANDAYTLAGTASGTANSALTSANGKTKVYRSLSAPSGLGGATGDIWWQYTDATYRIVSGTWTWDGDSWEIQKNNHQTISSVDIGTLTVIGTATISALVAQKIAAGTASIQQADIGNLTVTGTSTMASLVAQKIAAQTGQFMYLTAQQIDVNQLWADLAFSNQARTHLLSVLTNSDGTGYTSTITGQGLRVTYTSTDAGSVVDVQDVIKLGTFDQDHLSLYKDGKPSFVATVDGDVTARSISAEEIRYRGTTLQEILDALPRGHVSAALRITDSANNALSGYGEIPYLRLDVELEEGRLYKVWTSPIKMGISAGATAYLRLRGQSGAAATISSPLMNAVDLHQEGESMPLQELWATNPGAPVPGTRRQCSFLISFVVATGGGQAGIRASGANGVRLEVEDIGPLQSTGNGTQLNGPPVATPTAPAPTPPPSKSTYTKEYGNSDRHTYDGNNAIYSWPYPRGGQGLSPAGYGNLKSIWTFPSLTAELSGAVIHEVWAYFYFDQWFYNAGGTARIVLHGNASRPSTYTGITTGVVVASGSWPAGSGRWVKIPEAHYGGFANGTHKGFGLEGDGTYQTYGLASNCRLRIKYTK